MDAPAEVAFGTLLLGGVGLMLLLAVAFVGFVVTYRQRLMQQQLRQRGAEADHQQRLLTAVIAAQEAERERIGRDLHDDVASSISMAKMLVDHLSTTPNAADAAEMLALAREVLGSAVEDVRTVSHNLYPDQLARLGLVPALSHLADLCRRTEALAVAFDAHYPHPLPLVQELALYRICQELVHNTLKHASAAHLRIQLRQEDGNLLLSVEDDGCGFDPRPALDGAAAGGIGLRSIGVRVEMLGAELEQHSAPGLGTRTSIKLAHPQA